MPKNKAAQALGSLGGKATARKIAAEGLSERQRKARKLNMAKALQARLAKRDEGK